MKLIDMTSGSPGDEIILPNSLLWTDEFSWNPVTSAASYSLTGALILETGTMLKGRPISLEPPDESMGWVQRSVAAQLKTWAATANRKMRLVLEYADDTRTFNVMFRHHDGAIDAKPVKGFPEHSPDSWFNLTIRLIEV